MNTTSVAQINEELVEACKLALERLKPSKNIRKDFSKWVAYAALGQAIYHAEGHKHASKTEKARVGA